MASTANIFDDQKLTRRPDAKRHCGHSQGIGSPVYDASHRRIAYLKSWTKGSASHTPAFAILSCDGFLGPGDDCRPVPSSLLKTDPNGCGYQVGLSEAQLRAGPFYKEWASSDPEEWLEKAADYYGRLNASYPPQCNE